MRRIKIIGLALIAASAFAVVAVSTAQAADPLILVCSKVTTGKFLDANCLKPGSGTWEKLEILRGVLYPFRILSGAGTLSNSTGSSIVCTSDSGSGDVVGPDKVSGVVAVFSGCIGTENGEKCTVKSKSPLGKTGEIITNTLKGEYGLVATSEAPSGVGVDLESETGKVFVLIEKAPCAIEAAVEGSVAGEANPINEISLHLRLLFIGVKGGQSIKTITTLAGTEKPALSAFGVIKASEETHELLDFETAIEIM